MDRLAERSQRILKRGQFAARRGRRPLERREQCLLEDVRCYGLSRQASQLSQMKARSPFLAKTGSHCQDGAQT